MPTIRQITLPDGITYDLAATAINREVVPIVTEYSGSETTFNALEVTEDESQHTVYNVNLPNSTPLISWVDTADGTIIQSPTIKFSVQYNNNTTATFLRYDGSFHGVSVGNASSETPMSIMLEGNTSVYGDFKPTAGTYFLDSTALPQQTAAASYNVLCIDAFTNGGRAKFCTGTASATANTVAVRNGSGDIFARYYNTSCADQNPASYTSSVAFIDSNGYLRKSSKANFNTWAKDDSGSKTLNTTYGAYYERINGMCTVRVDYRSNVTSTISVGTLPSGYRPPWQVMAANATGGTNSSYLSVSATGAVQLAKVGSGGWCIATVTFPAV